MTATQATLPTGREPLPTPAPEREVLVTPAPDDVAIPGASLDTHNRRRADGAVRQKAGPERVTKTTHNRSLVKQISTRNLFSVCT